MQGKYRFQSVSVTGVCAFCGNTASGSNKAHNNNFYYYTVPDYGHRKLMVFAGSKCTPEMKTRGSYIKYTQRSLNQYQSAFETAVSACAREIPEEDAEKVVKILCMHIEHINSRFASGPAKAWWDDEGAGRLYVRIPGPSVHYAIVTSPLTSFDATGGLGPQHSTCHVRVTKVPWENNPNGPDVYENKEQLQGAVSNMIRSIVF